MLGVTELQYQVLGLLCSEGTDCMAPKNNSTASVSNDARQLAHLHILKAPVLIAVYLLL